MSLIVTDLSISFGTHRVVDRVSFEVPEGGRLVLVGESGSGKSQIIAAILGLLPSNAEVSGSIRWHGVEMVGAGDRTLADFRGREIGAVFQDPLAALNPIQRVGHQIGSALRIHYGLDQVEVELRTLEMMSLVGLEDAGALSRRYPHELSGGQRQRVAIAMALITGPRLLLADEPTTALDVVVQSQILSMVDHLVDSRGVGLLFVTHDLGIVAKWLGEGVVLSGGRVVERAPIRRLISVPQQPETRRLVEAARASALPDLSGGER